MSSPSPSTVKLKKLQRYVNLKRRQWQQQSSSVVKQSEVHQQVQFICKHLYATNQDGARIVAIWFQQKIEKAPKDSLDGETVYFKKNIANILEQLYQKIHRLTSNSSAATYKDSHRTSDRTFSDNSQNAGFAAQNLRMPPPKSNGSNSSIWNGNGERTLLNETRRGKNTIPKEILDVSVVRQVQRNFYYSYTPIIIQNSAKAGGMAFLFEGGLSGLENLVAIQRGEKTVEQGLQDTLSQAIEAGVISSVIVGGMSVITITPVVGPAAISAITASAPILTIVATVHSTKRLIDIFSNTPNLEGVDKIQLLLDSYGLNATELKFRDLEIEADLEQLRNQ
jgi:phage-related protein